MLRALKRPSRWSQRLISIPRSIPGPSPWKPCLPQPSDPRQSCQPCQSCFYPPTFNLVLCPGTSGVVELCQTGWTPRALPVSTPSPHNHQSSNPPCPFTLSCCCHRRENRVSLYLLRPFILSAGSAVPSLLRQTRSSIPAQRSSFDKHCPLFYI